MAPPRHHLPQVSSGLTRRPERRRQVGDPCGPATEGRTQKAVETEGSGALRRRLTRVGRDELQVATWAESQKGIAGALAGVPASVGRTQAGQAGQLIDAVLKPGTRIDEVVDGRRHDEASKTRARRMKVPVATAIGDPRVPSATSAAARPIRRPT